MSAAIPGPEPTPHIPTGAAPSGAAPRTAEPAGRVLDAARELAGARLTAQHWLLIAAVFAATVFDGYDTLNPSYVIHYVEGPWGLSSSQVGFLVSSGLIGFTVGALGHGPVADRYGRRPVMLAALLFSGVFSVLTAAAGDSFASFVLLRGLTGIGLGVIMPLGTAYITEFTPAASGTRMATGGICGYCLGGILASAVGIWLTPDLGWQILYWLGGGSVLVAAVLYAVLPESVQYLVLRGRHEAAARVLARLRPERREAYAGARFARPRDRAGAGEIVREITSRAYRRTTVALWITAFLVLFDIYGLSGWLPTLMERRGDGFAASFAFGALLQGAGIAGGLAAAHSHDRDRLRMGPGLTTLLGLGTVAVVLMAVVDTRASDVLFVAVAGFAVVGGQFVLNNLAARSYPVHLRGTGAGMMFGVGRIGAILGPYLGGWLIGWFDGTENVMFVAIAIATALGVLTSFFLYERPGGAGRAEPVPSSWEPGETRPVS